MRYTKSYLAKLEDLISETDYILRYEKGNFKPGYCILREKRIIIVNKFYSPDGKITCLREIIREIDINPKNLSKGNTAIYSEIIQTEIPI